MPLPRYTLKVWVKYYSLLMQHLKLFDFRDVYNSIWHYLRTLVCMHVQSCLTLCNPWTVAHRAPLSMGFSRQE